MKETEPPVIRETGFTAAHETLRQRQGNIVLALRNASGPEIKRSLLAGMLAHLVQDVCRNALSDPATPASAQDAKTAIRVFAPGLLASALMAFDDSSRLRICSTSRRWPSPPAGTGWPAASAPTSQSPI
ncbi:hypothetical protein [Nitratireductor aquibiodomus]|uniref:hypothetical protein n=1 Tax=Nitratireductor aquibiodomus TaxID=204799 RepID=UPI001FCC66B0|nr:hypothetical protein [Nitratireductor aquibiodomus]